MGDLIEMANISRVNAWNRIGGADSNMIQLEFANRWIIVFDLDLIKERHNLEHLLVASGCIEKIEDPITLKLDRLVGKYVNIDILKNG